MVTIKSVSATCSSGVLRLHGLVSLIGRMGFGHQRQSLGPSERGAFAGAVERRFAPGIEQVKALLALAALARGGGVHVKARRAAVDLRRADLHQFHQAFL